jgi:hypothetical protein
LITLWNFPKKIINFSFLDNSKISREKNLEAQKYTFLIQDHQNNPMLRALIDPFHLLTTLSG